MVISGVTEVKRLESNNLNNILWTFAKEDELSLFDKNFKGNHLFDDVGRLEIKDGRLEIKDGFSESVFIPNIPETLLEFSPGLDSNLKELINKLQ